jgi:hypothetical protein
MKYKISQLGLLGYAIWMPLICVTAVFSAAANYIMIFIGTIVAINIVSVTIEKITKIKKGIAITFFWCAVIIFAYGNIAKNATTTEMGVVTQGLSVNPTSYYDLLAQNMAKGQLDLPISSYEMNWSPDPYNPKKRNYGGYINDMSFYNGKNYLYYGITPLLLIILPVFFITGKFLSSGILLWIFSTIAFLSYVGVFNSLLKIFNLKSGRKNLNQLDGNLLACVFLTLGFGSFLPFLINKPHIYQVAQTSALAFSFLGIWALLKGFLSSSSNWSRGWFFGSGLFLAMAVGCRPTTIFTIIIVATVFHVMIKDGRFNIYHLISFLTPYAVYGAALAVYNYLRFDSFTEFGFSYVINHLTGKCVNFYGILIDIRDFLIMPPHFHNKYPFITLLWEWNLADNWKEIFDFFCEPCLGIAWVAPLLLLTVSVTALKTSGENAYYFCISLLVIGLILLLLVSRNAHEARYLADFIPYFLIPSLVVLVFLTNSKQSYLKFLLMTFAAISSFASTSIAYCTSRQGDLITFKGDEGSLDDEIAHFEKYKELNPELDMPYFVLGAFYTRKEDYEKALLNFYQAKRLNPEYPDVDDRIQQVLDIRKKSGADMGLKMDVYDGRLNYDIDQSIESEKKVTNSIELKQNF